MLFSGGEAIANHSMRTLLMEEGASGLLENKTQELAAHIDAAGRAICLEYSTPSAVYRLSGGPIESSVLVTVFRVRELAKHAPLRTRFGLTTREAEIAHMLAAGKSNSEIAEALRISPHTARHHTGSVMAKLGLPSRARVAGLLTQP